MEKMDSSGFSVLATSMLPQSMKADAFVAISNDGSSDIKTASFLSVQGNTVAMIKTNGKIWTQLKKGTIPLTGLKMPWQIATAVNPEEIELPYFVLVSPEAAVLWNSDTMTPVHTIDLRKLPAFTTYQPNLVNGAGFNGLENLYYIAFGNTNATLPGYVLTFTCDLTNFPLPSFSYDMTTFFYASPYNFLLSSTMEGSTFNWVETFNNQGLIMQLGSTSTTVQKTSVNFLLPNEQWAPFILFDENSHSVALLGSGLPGSQIFRIYVTRLFLSPPSLIFRANITLGLFLPQLGLAARNGRAGVVAARVAGGTALAWTVFRSSSAAVEQPKPAVPTKPIVPLDNCSPSDCTFADPGSCDPDKCWAILGTFSCCKTPPR